MLFDEFKIKNNFIKVELDDLKKGDKFLFEDEPDNAQKRVVYDIYKATETSAIVVEYFPETTPVRNCSMFQYGKMKIKKF